MHARCEPLADTLGCAERSSRTNGSVAPALYMYVHARVCVCTCACTCVHVHVRVRICMHVYVCACACTCVYPSVQRLSGARLGQHQSISLPPRMYTICTYVLRTPLYIRDGYLGEHHLAAAIGAHYSPEHLYVCVHVRPYACTLHMHVPLAPTFRQSTSTAPGQGADIVESTSFLAERTYSLACLIH